MSTNAHVHQKRQWLALCICFAAIALSPAAHPATITVDSLLDNGNGSDGLCTLREALLAAALDAFFDGCDGGSGADEIVFDPALFPMPLQLGIISLSDELLLGSDSVSIVGPSDASLSIIAAPDSRIFTIDQADDSVFSLSNVLLRDGSASVGGAICILSGGEVVLNSVSIVDSIATSSNGGGAIIVLPDAPLTLTISDSVFSANTAPNGGAIRASTDSLLTMAISDSRFSGNSADDGGAINITAVEGQIDLTIASTEFDGNVASRRGGSLYVGFNGTPSTFALNASDSVWQGNVAAQAGAAVYIDSSLNGPPTTVNVEFVRSRFESNESAWTMHGGAIGIRGSRVNPQESLSIRRSSFVENFGPSGSAVYVERVSTELLNSVFVGNQGPENGALAIDLSQKDVPTSVHIAGNTFHDNRSMSTSDPNHFFMAMPYLSESSVRFLGNVYHQSSVEDAGPNCLFDLSGTNDLFSRYNASNRTGCAVDVFDIQDPNLQVEVRPLAHPIHKIGVHLPQDSSLIDIWPDSECTDQAGTPLAADLAGDRRDSGNPDWLPINGNPLTFPGCDPGAFEAPLGRLLTLRFAGSGEGRLDADGIQCVDDCALAFADGESVEVTAVAEAGSGFLGWSGACSGISSCVVHMHQSMIVVAEFIDSDQIFMDGFE